jgi:hypothetical protein
MQENYPNILKKSRIKFRKITIQIRDITIEEGGKKKIK